MLPSSLAFNRRPFPLGSDLLDRHHFAESESAKVLQEQSRYNVSKETVTEKIAMSDTLQNARVSSTLLETQINAMRASESAPANRAIYVASIIVKVIGRTLLPEKITYVLHARKTAVTRSATSVSNDDDSTDYSKYASFELPAGIQEYTPRVFDPRDATWSQAWAKRTVANRKFKSELQEATTLLNAGVWTEYALLSFELAYEVAEESGLVEGHIQSLLNISRMYMDTAYDALRNRRDYLEYRHHDWSGADHLERVTAANRATYLMHSTARKHRKTLTAKIVEAMTKIHAQKRAAGNVATASGAGVGKGVDHAFAHTWKPGTQKGQKPPTRSGQQQPLHTRRAPDHNHNKGTPNATGSAADKAAAGEGK